MFDAQGFLSLVNAVCHCQVDYIARSRAWYRHRADVTRKR